MLLLFAAQWQKVSRRAEALVKATRTFKNFAWVYGLAVQHHDRVSYLERLVCQDIIGLNTRVQWYGMVWLRVNTYAARFNVCNTYAAHPTARVRNCTPQTAKTKVAAPRADEQAFASQGLQLALLERACYSSFRGAYKTKVAMILALALMALRMAAMLVLCVCVRTEREGASEREREREREI